MLIFAVAFLFGDKLLLLLPSLPSQYWLVINVILIIIFLYLKKIQKYTKYIIPLLAGFTWTSCYTHYQTAWILPPELENKPIQITGTVTTIPVIQPHGTSFRVSINTTHYSGKTKKAHGYIQLNWQNTPQKIHIGDTWHFTARLKRIHGLMNQGGFDYEAWSLQEGVRASGYVIGNATLLSSRWYLHPLDRFREFLGDAIKDNLPKSPTSPWITALAIGERQNIQPADWEVLRNTGTNHLMAIAGLHIGFMAAFFYKIANWIWRRHSQLLLLLPAQEAGAVAALIMALVYSAMAGFSLPTQRACLMLLVILFIMLLRRKVALLHIWSLALLCVLLCNPLSVLTDSFWLSFGSVALIIYSMRGRIRPKGLWWRHGRIQWALALGLMPLGVWLFQECSLIAFIANSIAIPCVGFLIIPSIVLGCCLVWITPQVGGEILSIADKILQKLWLILAYLAHLPSLTWHQYVPSMWYIITACISIFILLLPIGFPGRMIGIIWLLPMILYQSPVPARGDVWFTLLDVGQGLSAVVQTKSHILVFDAGARLSDTQDRGETVVLPYLRSIAVTHIDQLVISHGDNDHIGGANAIINKMPTYIVKSSVPEQFHTVPASYCLQGESWEWDQVRFEFLYPSLSNLGLNNNSSCVLRITSGTHHLLLTGDIEKKAELYLVNSPTLDLSADILVAPHHGSNTSDLDEFIQNVHPTVVLFPVGYLNRYHFPHASVLKKYTDMGIIAYDTVHAGMIQFKIEKNKRINDPVLYRKKNYTVKFNKTNLAS